MIANVEMGQKIEYHQMSEKDLLMMLPAEIRNRAHDINWNREIDSAHLDNAEHRLNEIIVQNREVGKAYAEKYRQNRANMATNKA